MKSYKQIVIKSGEHWLRLKNHQWRRQNNQLTDRIIDNYNSEDTAVANCIHSILNPPQLPLWEKTEGGSFLTLVPLNHLTQWTLRVVKFRLN